MHLPRSVFSEKQTELILWVLRVTGVNYVPSVKTLKDLQKRLQGIAGVESLECAGSLGHIYWVNDMRRIIAQVNRVRSLMLCCTHSSR